MGSAFHSYDCCMSEKEAEALCTVYQKWTTERLARAATLEKGDYQPEAVVLMLEELNERSVTSEVLAKLAASPPPPVVEASVERNTRFFPARLDRKQYAIRFLLWLAATFVGSLLFELTPMLQPGAFVLWVLAALVYRVVGLDIPRIKNAGMAPYLVFMVILLLVPVANLVGLVILFAAPPKK